MIVRNTIGPLARGTSVLDAAKSMVINESPYALLEGAPLKMIDAVQILRALVSANTPIEMAEVLTSDVEEIAYEVPTVEESEAAKALLIKGGAVALKGGSIADPLYVLAENKSSFGDETIKKYVDDKVKLVDPLLDIVNSVRRSLMYDLEGYVIVGQKRPFGIVTPINLLKYLTSDVVVSALDAGDNSALERAIGDLASSIPTYITPETSLKDVVSTLLEQRFETFPVVGPNKNFLGAIKARSLLVALLG